MTTPPLCPTMPECWTAEVAKLALDHAREAYPAEAAGMVDGAGLYHRLENVSAQPKDDVHLGDDDLLRVASEAVCFFHSHPDGIGCPSTDDMIYQQQLGIPFVIAALPALDVFCFGDPLPPQPLVGRGFRHGVHDCYAVIRDWYRERGIDRLWDQPRGWEWWSKDQNLYLENFAEAGFVQIAPSEATREGDVLLFRFNYKVPMHGGVLLSPTLMLHHASGVRPVDRTRLSAPVPRIRYAQHITYALRHADVA